MRTWAADTAHSGMCVASERKLSFSYFSKRNEIATRTPCRPPDRFPTPAPTECQAGSLLITELPGLKRGPSCLYWWARPVSYVCLGVT